jgi:hypothetical protein
VSLIRKKRTTHAKPVQVREAEEASKRLRESLTQATQRIEQSEDLTKEARDSLGKVKEGISDIRREAEERRLQSKSS